jgi:hypothetical protein
VLDELGKKVDRHADERERATKSALVAAQKAIAVAAVTAQTTDKILAKQDIVQQQVVEANAVAKATEIRLDTATRPALAARPWIGDRR